MKMRPATVREAYLQASSFLQQHQVRDAAHCAELMLQHILQWDRSQLLLNWQEPFLADRAEQWKEWLERKAAGEPVQYIIGEQEFYGLRFVVNSSVLIPRPETELLVEQIIRRGRELFGMKESPVAVDIGSGSGAIAVSLAVHNPNWTMMSSDLSMDALKIARINAGINGVGKRITFMQGDLLEPYIAGNVDFAGMGQTLKKQTGPKHIDILVSNPPYIPAEDIADLQVEVRDYEPRLALDGGDDGLNLYRRMIGQMELLPAYPKLVGFEVGQGQAEEVAAMLRCLDVWKQVEIVPDLAGIARHVVGWRI